MSTPPTGAQLELRHGDQVAQVVQVGGGLRSYDVGGRPVLDGYPADARPDGGRGQVLAPWPNRVRDGRYTFDGAEQQLALTEVAKRNAIHGLVRWSEWSVVDRSAASVGLAVRVWPQPGYPFHLDLRATYALRDDGLTTVLLATNAGDLYRLQLVDKRNHVEGAWRDLRRRGDPGATGVVDQVLRTTTGLVLRFTPAGQPPVTVNLRPNFTGELNQGGKVVAVAMRKAAP